MPGEHGWAGPVVSKGERQCAPPDVQGYRHRRAAQNRPPWLACWDSAQVPRWTYISETQVPVLRPHLDTPSSLRPQHLYHVPVPTPLPRPQPTAAASPSQPRPSSASLACLGAKRSRQGLTDFGRWGPPLLPAPFPLQVAGLQPRLTSQYPPARIAHGRQHTHPPTGQGQTSAPRTDCPLSPTWCRLLLFAAASSSLFAFASW